MWGATTSQVDSPLVHVTFLGGLRVQELVTNGRKVANRQLDTSTKMHCANEASRLMSALACVLELAKDLWIGLFGSLSLALNLRSGLHTSSDS